MLFVGDLNMVMEHSTDILSGVPKYKKVVIYFMVKVCGIDHFHEGAHYSAVAYEFNVNGQYAFNKVSLSRNTPNTYYELIA